MSTSTSIRKRAKTKTGQKIERTIVNIVEHISPIKGPENETRDHLSNERTFLAYIRTGGSFMAMGITIILLGRFSVKESISELGNLQNLDHGEIIDKLKHDEMVVDKYCKPSGIVVAVSGIITIICGAIRYTINFKLLDHRRNVFMSGSLFSSIIFCTLLVVTVLAFILMSGL